MKLLASLLGCAAADYACCPYDDFGVVNKGCALSEKTPWAMQNLNIDADPMGVEHHLCKSWEANIDATMEGNEDKDNWGGCGFQRHFPWGMVQAELSAGTLVSTTQIQTTYEQCKMGMFDCSHETNPIANFYKGFRVGGSGGSMFHLEKGPFAGPSATNWVLGDVTLGGVCKLWIPVNVAAIDSVSIAGVHMNGGGINKAVFSTDVCNTVDCLTSTGVVAGTAYCFSVVNIGEFMENNMPGSDHQVMNANVAGKDLGGINPILLQSTDSAMDFTNDAGDLVEFGSSIRPTNPSGGSTTMVEAGASFDVVVHFKSTWCIKHWTIVDMQAVPDNNSGVVDYPLADNGNGDPQHAHTDVADKRFNGQIGICGCCKSDGLTRHDLAASLTTTTAESCFACTSCIEFNKYAGQVPASMKWPNAGAWAAYYSFITCADNTFMVYDVLAAGSIDATTGVVTATATARDVVHSMFYNDIRHDHSNNHHNTGDVRIRGNFRQVGSEIQQCGPGIIDTNTQRCTWNWNFSTNSAVIDAEEWFQQSNPNFNTWKNGDHVDRNDETDAFSSTTITKVVGRNTFAIIFGADSDLTVLTTGTGGGSDPTRLLTLDAAKYFTASTDITTTATFTISAHTFTFTQWCLQSKLDGNGAPILAAGLEPNLDALGGAQSNFRDNFPDCYMGDEIHFEYAIAGASTTANNDQRISAWYSSVTATFDT